MSFTKTLVSSAAAIALTVSASAPAFAFEPKSDQRVMAYWSFDLGGPAKKSEDRAKLGLSVNFDASHNSAYANHGTAFGHSSFERPAFMDLQLGFDGTMKGLALNGSDLLAMDQALYADGEEGEGGTLFGIKWYYVLFAAMGAGSAAYLIYDAFSSEDDDEETGGGGGGGGGGAAGGIPIVGGLLP